MGSLGGHLGAMWARCGNLGVSWGPFGTLRGARERFWTTKIVPRNAPRPPPGTLKNQFFVLNDRIYTIQAFRAKHQKKLPKNRLGTARELPGSSRGAPGKLSIDQLFASEGSRPAKIHFLRARWPPRTAIWSAPAAMLACPKAARWPPSLLSKPFQGPLGTI